MVALGLIGLMHLFLEASLQDWIPVVMMMGFSGGTKYALLLILLLELINLAPIDLNSLSKATAEDRERSSLGGEMRLTFVAIKVMGTQAPFVPPIMKCAILQLSSYIAHLNNKTYFDLLFKGLIFKIKK